MVRGYTEASRRVAVSARTGLIVASPFSQGDSVKPATSCASWTWGRARRSSPRPSSTRQRQPRLRCARKLALKNFVSASKMASEKARLDLAAAEREQIVQDIGCTPITSPISGVLVSKPAEAGGFLQAGDLCATISVLDPINVVAQAGERDIAAIHTGMQASARLATGETVSGIVRFIAPAADLATRTFRVEMEVANPDRKLREGVTAELSVPLPPVKAHLLPPSVLTLDDAGQFGVRIIAAGNKAQFLPVTVLSQERQGTWVTGLPETVTVITVGQDFVVDGQTVEPRPEIPGAG